MTNDNQLVQGNEQRVENNKEKSADVYNEAIDNNSPDRYEEALKKIGTIGLDRQKTTQVPDAPNGYDDALKKIEAVGSDKAPTRPTHQAETAGNARPPRRQQPSRELGQPLYTPKPRGEKDPKRQAEEFHAESTQLKEDLKADTTQMVDNMQRTLDYSKQANAAAKKDGQQNGQQGEQQMEMKIPYRDMGKKVIGMQMEQAKQIVDQVPESPTTAITSSADPRLQAIDREQDPVKAIKMAQALYGESSGETSKTSADGVRTTFFPDGRKKATVYPDGDTYFYDAEGNHASRRDQYGGVYTYYKDGHTKSYVSPNGWVINYGNKGSVIGGATHPIVSKTDPNGTTTYYDADGNVTDTVYLKDRQIVGLHYEDFYAGKQSNRIFDRKHVNISDNMAKLIANPNVQGEAKGNYAAMSDVQLEQALAMGNSGKLGSDPNSNVAEMRAAVMEKERRVLGFKSVAEMQSLKGVRDLRLEANTDWWRGTVYATQIQTALNGGNVGNIADPFSQNAVDVEIKNQKNADMKKGVHKTYERYFNDITSKIPDFRKNYRAYCLLKAYESGYKPISQVMDEEAQRYLGGVQESHKQEMDAILDDDARRLANDKLAYLFDTVMQHSVIGKTLSFIVLSKSERKRLADIHNRANNYVGTGWQLGGEGAAFFTDWGALKVAGAAAKGTTLLALGEEGLEYSVGQRLCSGLNLAIYNTANQATSDLYNGEFSGILPYASGIVTGLGMGGSLSYTGEGTRNWIADRLLGKTKADKFFKTKKLFDPNTKLGKTTSFSTKFFVEGATMGGFQTVEQMAMGEKVTPGENMFNSYMLLIPMKIGKGEKQYEPSDKTISEVERAGGKELADALRENRDRMRRGLRPLRYTQEAKRQYEELFDDMVNGGRVTWSTYAELAMINGDALYVPRPRKGRLIDRDGKKVLQMLDANDAIITEKEYKKGKEKKAQQDYDELIADIDRTAQGDLLVNYEFNRQSAIMSDVMRQMYREGFFQNEEPQFLDDGTPNPNFMEVSPDEIIDKYWQIRNQQQEAEAEGKEDPSTEFEKQFVEKVNSLYEEHSQNYTSAEDIMKEFAKQYDVFEEDFLEAFFTSPEKRGKLPNKNAVKAVEAYNEYMGRGFNDISGKEVARATLSDGSVVKLTKLPRYGSDGKPVNSHETLIAIGENGERRFISPSEIEGLEELPNPNADVDARYQQSKENAARMVEEEMTRLRSVWEQKTTEELIDDYYELLDKSLKGDKDGYIKREQYYSYLLELEKVLGDRGVKMTTDNEIQKETKPEYTSERSRAERVVDREGADPAEREERIQYYIEHPLELDEKFKSYGLGRTNSKPSGYTDTFNPDYWEESMQAKLNARGTKVEEPNEPEEPKVEEVEGEGADENPPAKDEPKEPKKGEPKPKKEDVQDEPSDLPATPTEDMVELAKQLHPEATEEEQMAFATEYANDKAIHEKAIRDLEELRKSKEVESQQVPKATDENIDKLLDAMGVKGEDNRTLMKEGYQGEENRAEFEKDWQKYMGKKQEPKQEPKKEPKSEPKKEPKQEPKKEEGGTQPIDYDKSVPSQIHNYLYGEGSKYSKEEADGMVENELQDAKAEVEEKNATLEAAEENLKEKETATPKTRLTSKTEAEYQAEKDKIEEDKKAAKEAVEKAKAELDAATKNQIKWEHVKEMASSKPEPKPEPKTKTKKGKVDLEAVKERVARFPEETEEESAEFDASIPSMSDEELLAYMEEYNKADFDKSYHPLLYNEYNHRHADEFRQEYDKQMRYILDNYVSQDEAKRMFEKLKKKGIPFTKERTAIEAQMEALNNFIRNEFVDEWIKEHKWKEPKGKRTGGKKKAKTQERKQEEVSSEKSFIDKMKATKKELKKNPDSTDEDFIKMVSEASGKEENLKPGSKLYNDVMDILESYDDGDITAKQAAKEIDKAFKNAERRLKEGRKTKAEEIAEQYSLGKRGGKGAAIKEEGKVFSKRTPGEGGFVDESEFNKWKSRDEKLAVLMDGIAKKLGLKIKTFHDGESRERGRIVGDTIWVNASTGDSLGFLVGHEMLHDVKKADGKLYEQYSKLAQESAKRRFRPWGKIKTYEDDLKSLSDIYWKHYKDLYVGKGYSEEEAAKLAEKHATIEKMMEETDADESGYILEDAKAAAELLKRLDPEYKRTWKDIALNILDNAMAHIKFNSKKYKQYKETKEALIAAYNETFKERLENNGIQIADKGDAEADFSLTDRLEGKAREKAIKDLMEVTGRSESTVKKWLAAEESLARVILAGDNQKFLDLQVDESVPSIWKNSDYPQGTVEFSNICRKRLPFTVIYQKLQEEFPNRVFDASTLEDIRRIMKENGEDVACGLCFVEDRRQLLGEIGDGFIKALKGEELKADEGLEDADEDTKKSVNKKQRQAIDKLRESGDTYIPNLYELLTLDGMKKLRKSHPAVAQAFVEYNNARGMQAGRLFQAYSAYHREIRNWSKAKIKKVNDAGGLRIFSFSDFEAHHLIDLVQVLTDCASKGVKVQGYTKVPEFAKAVKDTKMKVNRSLIAKAKGFVDESYVPQEGEAVSPNVIDGKRLLLDTVEGIDVNHPDFFDAKSNKNVGNILVGISDEHIRLAMQDPFVDYIIPFHSGLKQEIRNKKGIGDWTNYKMIQLEKKYNEKGNLVNADKHGINIYTDVLPRGEELIGKPIRTARDFQMAFFKACEEKGWIPRFSKFINKNKKGQYVYTPGYEKLLIDFKLFDKNGRILPQEAVEPKFDNKYNKTILDKYVEGEKSKVPYDELYDKVKDGLGLGEQSSVEQMAQKAADKADLKESINYSLIGRAGAERLDARDKGTRMMDRDLAEIMEEDGEDAESIKYMTGWERGADNKWRYEIPDITVKDKDWAKKTELRLGDFVDAPELFAAYPDLKDIRVLPKKVSFFGEYNVKDNSITIDRKSNKKLKELHRTLAHEIQHAIQEREGFARGGDYSDIPDTETYLSAPEEIKGMMLLGTKNSFAKLKRIGSNALAEVLEESLGEGNVTDKYVSTITSLRDALKVISGDDYKDLISTSKRTMTKAKKEAKDNYHRLAGEVEARNVEKRLDMSDTGRLVTTAEATEDVPRDKQIVQFSLSPEEQRKQQESKNFKDWFGDWENDPENASKVVDENGRPLVVYHGTKLQEYYWKDGHPYTRNTPKFYTFKSGFFSPDRDAALQFAGGNESKLYTTYLDIKKPLVIDAKGQPFDNIVLEDGRTVSTDQIANEARNSGEYDGVIIKNVQGEDNGNIDRLIDDYIPFYPEQIKSATDNNGDFSRENPDIRYSLAPNMRPTFYSNAARAVENIKQNKATAEQWLAMIKKNGGLKAGEDKWMGLSQWLEDNKGKSLTKEEVQQFIADNGIEMEEVNYKEDATRFDEAVLTIKDLALSYGSTQRAIDEVRSTKEAQVKFLEDKLPLYRKNPNKYADRINRQERYLKKYKDDIDFLDNLTEEDIDNYVAPEEINRTRLDYTTKGLDNKREIAFKVPSVEPYQEHDAIHFGPENQGKAVMWVRFGETADADGKRVLVIDEIQSNRHQDARENGYYSPKTRDKATVEKELRGVWAEINKFESNNFSTIARLNSKRRDAELQQLPTEKREEYEILQQKLKNLQEEWNTAPSRNSAVPEAPFEKNWHEVAMKRMLRLAAEEGFDKVAWTTGAQQAARYDIGKMVKSVESSEWGADEKDMKTIFVEDRSEEWSEARVDRSGKIDSATNMMETFVGENVSDVFGKEMAARLMGETPETIEGDGLRIGGSGMKGFYDQMLPRFMDKYGKRWGVKTGEVELNTPGKEVMHSVDVTPEMKESVMEGQPLFSLDPEYMGAVQSGDMEKAQRMVDKSAEDAGYTIRGEHGTTHKFTIFNYDLANMENSFGKGHYFTNSKDDAKYNYASDEGADLTNRIELMAEQMEFWDGYENKSYEERKEEAKKQLNGGENRVISAALRMQNPVVFSYDPEGKYKETFFDFEEPYDEEYDEYGEPSGLLVDFTKALQQELNEGDYFGADRVNVNDLYDGSDGYTADQLKKACDDMLAYVTDDEGAIASNEIFKNALKRMGFDGIIDNAPSHRFKNMGLGRGTKHFIVFDSNQIKQTDPVTYDDNGNVIPLSERFNLRNPDIRYSLSTEIAKKYPNWMDNQVVEDENSSKGQRTQVTKTVGTYKKVGKWISEHLGKDVSILDASSGMGLGTAELLQDGFNIEDIEPYPSKKRMKTNPPKHYGEDAYAKAKAEGKKYDYIISNAVLNVIPDDWRNNVLHDMADLLNVGGKMFINTRKTSEAKNVKNKIELESPNEILVGTPENITSYQRFFTPKELKEYVERELGEGYTVEIANEKNSGTKGLSAVVVTKTKETPQFSLAPGEKAQGGTYFSGGGLIESGLEDVLDKRFGVEYDEKIAGVYRNNHGEHIVVADVRNVDPMEMAKKVDGPVQYFHASPVCKNFSKMKKGEETPLDIETAQSTADAIEKMRPRIVTIENVEGYASDERKALGIITNKLKELGYNYDINVVNAADYGAATNRRRLIVRAVADGYELPPLPEGNKKPTPWFERVKDLIPTLKETTMPKWMDERLQEAGIDWRNIDKPLFVNSSGNMAGSIAHAFGDKPAPTIAASRTGDKIIMPDGKVYAVNGRVLARLMGLPDSYQLPRSETLAKTVLGNGVPVELTKGVIEPLVREVADAAENVQYSLGNLEGEERLEYTKRLREIYRNGGNVEENIRQLDEEFEQRRAQAAVDNDEPLPDTGFDSTSPMQIAVDAQMKAINNVNTSDTVRRDAIKSVTKNIRKICNALRNMTFGKLEEETWQKLSDLEEAYEAGVFTKEEYERQKKELEALSKGDTNTNVRMATTAQRDSDHATVSEIVAMARTFIESGLLDDLGRADVKSILGDIKRANGKTSVGVRNEVEKLFDLMLKHQEKRTEASILDLLTTPGAKVNAGGVKVVGKVDADTKKILDTMAMYLGPKMQGRSVEEMEDALRRLSSADVGTMNERQLKEHGNMVFGAEMAKRYAQTVVTNRNNIAEAEAELQSLKAQYKNGEIDITEYRERKRTVENSIRDYKTELIKGLWETESNLRELVAGGKKGAKTFFQKIVDRANQVRHWAYSDMKGLDTATQKDATFRQKWANSFVNKWISMSQYTFMTMLRAFGRNALNGEGYMFDNLGRTWMDNAGGEWKDDINDMRELNAKANELFGNLRVFGRGPQLPGFKYQWHNLIDVLHRLPRIDVEYRDGGKMRRYKRDQAQVAYIYAANKQPDGAMKLRAMGISEAQVAELKAKLDPRVVKLVDWLQEDFLPSRYKRYNEVYERMFGVPMTMHENYFPLEIDKLSIAEKNKDDVFNASTTTGSVKERKFNINALDLKNCNIISMTQEHLYEMNHWKNFAEWNRDLNTLLNDKTFRAKVHNFVSFYGSGKDLWDKFKDVSLIASGDYIPASGKADKLIVNLAKLVSTAKVNWRTFTASKQILSFLTPSIKSNPLYFIKNLANEYGTIKWCFENLPLFEKRWISRRAGDARLQDTELDWKYTRTKFIKWASKWGLTPNAAVDLWACAIGARSVYDTMHKNYLKRGYTEAEAHKRAIQDAEMTFNESQQSSEAAFLAPMQVDRTLPSVALSVFRTSPFGFTRLATQGFRNVKYTLSPWKWQEHTEYMLKKMQRDGLTEQQARDFVKTIHRRSLVSGLANIFMYAFGAQFMWNYGSKMPYLFGSDNDDKKKDITKEELLHAATMGYIEGLPAGNVASDSFSTLINAYIEEESLEDMWKSYADTERWRDNELLPMFGDFSTMSREVYNGEYLEGLTDLFNLGIQALSGTNPQTFTDAMVAVMEACNNDPKTAKDALLLWYRLTQVPQSQIEDIYVEEAMDMLTKDYWDDDLIKETGMTRKQIEQMTLEDFARRYAGYRRLRRAPYLWELYNQEKKKAQVDKYEKRFYEKIKAGVDDPGSWRDLAKRDTPRKETYVKKYIADLEKADGIDGLVAAADAETDPYIKGQLVKRCDEIINKEEIDKQKAQKAAMEEAAAEKEKNKKLTKAAKYLPTRTLISTQTLNTRASGYDSDKDSLVAQCKEIYKSFGPIYADEKDGVKIPRPIDKVQWQIPVKDPKQRKKILDILNAHPGHFNRALRVKARNHEIGRLIDEIDADTTGTKKDVNVKKIIEINNAETEDYKNYNKPKKK